MGRPPNYLSVSTHRRTSCFGNQQIHISVAQEDFLLFLVNKSLVLSRFVRLWVQLAFVLLTTFQSWGKYVSTENCLLKGPLGTNVCIMLYYVSVLN